MDFVSYFLRRPVIATALSMCLFLAGAISVIRLPISLFPSVQLNSITVSASYPGATADLMDGRIASEILSAVSDVEGIDHVVSRSMQDRTQVDLTLDIGTDLEDALSQVGERVRAISSFPQDMDPVEVRRQEVDTAPDYALAFTSEQMTPPEVTEYLERVAKPRIQSLSGVATVEVLGSQYAMRIWLDPVKLERYNLTAVDVSAVLKQGNVQINAGTFRSGDRRSSILVTSGLSSVEGFRNLPIGSSNVRLGDVASIEMGSREPNIRSRFNGQPATVMFVKWRAGANPLRVGAQVNDVITSMETSFPFDLQAKVLVDNTDYIRIAIEEVVLTIFATSAIVVLVLFLGTGALRATVIPMVVIPLSLVGICAVMLLAGFSINTLTLLAMVLAIGLVVDDAIVVLDASIWHIEQGKTPISAAAEGTRSLAGSLLTMTLTLAIAYLPLAFAGGLVGELFTEFAVTLAGAVMLSGVIAVTLTPLMCGRILSRRHSQIRTVHRVEAAFAAIRRVYQRSLVRALRVRSLLVLVWMICLGATVVLYITTPRILAPTEDQSSLMVLAQAPESTNIDFIEGEAQRLENIYKHLPGVENYNYVAGVPAENRLMSFIRLKDWAERDQTAMQLQPLLQSELNAIPSLQSVAIVPTSLPGAGGLPFQFVLKQQDRDYVMLDALSDGVLRRLRQSHLFLFARKDLSFASPQVRLQIDRQKAAEQGISASDIGFNISLAYANARLQPFTYHGRTYNVVMQLDPKATIGADPLGSINVRTKSGNLVRTSALATKIVGAVPTELNRFQGQASVTISGVLAPGVGLSQAVAYVEALMDDLDARGVTTDLAGETRRSTQENIRLQWTFVLAVLGIYFLLALQFQNYRDPLVVLLGSLPLAAFGALLAMHSLEISLNIFTQIGLLTLCGLICKQGILMVQAANSLRENGMCNLSAAIVRASGSRLRAIVLTSLTLALGAMPLLLAYGPASASRYELGVVLVAGMVLGPLLCLYLLPALYLVLGSKRQATSFRELEHPVGPTPAAGSQLLGGLA